MQLALLITPLSGLLGTLHPLLALETHEVISLCGNLVYLVEAYLAIAGTYYSVLLFRRVRQKSFRSLDARNEFLTALRELMRADKWDDALKLCKTPRYWRVAVPQLCAMAIQNRKDDLGRLKRNLVIKFESDIIASLDHILSYIFTFVRMGPLSGLLGTVLSMIAAFARLGTAGHTKVDPGQLAGDISLALWATAIGLLIATPLTLVGNAINVRIRKLEDASQEALQQFMEDFERSPGVARRAAPSRQLVGEKA